AGRLTVAAGLVGVGLFALPSGAVTEACASAVLHFADGWAQITPPSFASGDHALVDYALDTGTVDHLLATNGTQLSRSTDGGCSWQHASLPQPPSIAYPT